LPIPESLIILIQLGRWQAGYQETPLEHIQRFAPEEHKLFFDRPPFGKPEGSLGNLDYFRGEPDEEAPPGDIDFARAVIIGDFGHGSDAPIALDYRKSLDNPSVIRYHWSPYGKNNRWVYVASSFEEFAKLLQL
ncbi:hypothetical protein, partial [Armatimonas sp.]|uniref:hypothetical protein n=1 Tax=Armatimonas sp. TaxID=1872638 RepID=UPI00375151FD